jgi:hypothetical protein
MAAVVLPFVTLLAAAVMLLALTYAARERGRIHARVAALQRAPAERSTRVRREFHWLRTRVARLIGASRRVHGGILVAAACV